MYEPPSFQNLWVPGPSQVHSALKDAESFGFYLEFRVEGFRVEGSPAPPNVALSKALWSLWYLKA